MKFLIGFAIFCFTSAALATDCSFKLTKNGKESKDSKSEISQIIANSCRKGEPLTMVQGSSRGHIAIIRKYCDLDNNVISLGGSNYGNLGFICRFNGNKSPLVEADFENKKWF